jgi:hypothetical protein
VESRSSRVGYHESQELNNWTIRNRVSKEQRNGGEVENPQGGQEEKGQFYDHAVVQASRQEKRREKGRKEERKS